MNVSQLLKCQTFTLCVDGNEMCVATDFIQAFKAYISCFYVFNIEFPRSLCHTFQFMEKVLLKTQTSTKKSAKAKRAVELLSKREMRCHKKSESCNCSINEMFQISQIEVPIFFYKCRLQKTKNKCTTHHCRKLEHLDFKQEESSLLLLVLNLR